MECPFALFLVLQTSKTSSSTMSEKHFGGVWLDFFLSRIRQLPSLRLSKWRSSAVCSMKHLREVHLRHIPLQPPPRPKVFNILLVWNDDGPLDYLPLPFLPVPLVVLILMYFSVQDVCPQRCLFNLCPVSQAHTPPPQRCSILWPLLTLGPTRPLKRCRR